jgi:hypothetical protein
LKNHLRLKVRELLHSIKHKFVVLVNVLFGDKSICVDTVTFVIPETNKCKWVS